VTVTFGKTRSVMESSSGDDPCTKASIACTKAMMRVGRMKEVDQIRE
ncbi:MAG: hypothetical protein JWO89_1514, partial [Verrucomicrobiaceae bacterium]|nr:hypothetical protein [Verrucomicrobiaceae bacterium]